MAREKAHLQNIIMKKDMMQIGMSDDKVMKKWLSAFGKNVDKRLMEEHVTSYGNLLWHLFTWGEVPCLQGDDARKAFDNLQYEEAIRFYDGYFMDLCTHT